MCMYMRMCVTVCVKFPAHPNTRSELHAGSGQLSLAALAVFALAPDSAVGADGGAPTVLADAPAAVMLADGGAPQSLQKLLMRLCWQMLVPPQSLHKLLRLLC